VNDVPVKWSFLLKDRKLAISCSNPPIKIKCVPENDMKADHNNVWENNIAQSIWNNSICGFTHHTEINLTD
jgi:hypothetical protein